jgi:tetratricopeptide (TPR) repeat protein
MTHRTLATATTISLFLLSACGGKDKAAGSSATATATRDIETAHLIGDSAGLSAAIVAFDDSARKNQNDTTLLHRAAYAAYRRANLAGDDPAELAAQLARARESLERANRMSPIAENYAMLSSVIARQAVLDTARAAELHAASTAAMDSAASLGPENPRVLLMRGIAAFYTAPKDSGGPAVAERLLTRAIELFATEKPVAGAPSWGHAEAYAWLGQAQSEQGNVEAAVASYRKALEIAPQYGWVAGALLPDAMRRAGARKS